MKAPKCQKSAKSKNSPSLEIWVPNMFLSIFLYKMVRSTLLFRLSWGALRASSEVQRKFMISKYYGQFWIFCERRLDVNGARKLVGLQQRVGLRACSLQGLQYNAQWFVVFIFCCNILKSQICVEPQNLPVGPPKTNERGECCAPLYK